MNAEQSAREEAPVTPPFRLNTARRPNAGVAEEPPVWSDPKDGGVFEVIRIKSS